MLYIKQKGSVGYTIVGSPTIVDGVASGFSVSDYLNLSSTLTSFDEIVLSFIPGTYSSGRNVLFKTGINDYRGAFQQVSDTQGQYFYTKTDNTAGNRYVPCTPGIVNIFKIQYISENSISCILSRQGYEDSTFDLTDVDISATFGGSIYLGRGTSAYNAWSGSIDLNNTYIKVNGQPWFGICPIEVKKHQLMGPVGYTITGTGPTVTDGILTGVGGSSTVYTSQNIPSFETFELVIKVKKNGLSPNDPLPALALSSTAGDASYRVVAGGVLSLRVGSSTPIVSLDNFPYATLAGEWFYIKLNVAKNGNNYDYSIGYSTDKQNWTTGTGTSSSVFTQAIGFLRNSSGNGGTSSYIDFNETYIKINGKLWFWQPRETEKIVVNGVQVWQKSS